MRRPSSMGTSRIWRRISWRGVSFSVRWRSGSRLSLFARLRLVALASDNLTRLCPRRLAILQHLNAIDPDVLHAGGQLVRLLERGVIGDRRRIETDDIRPGTRRQLATIRQTEVLGRKRREP